MYPIFKYFLDKKELILSVVDLIIMMKYKI